VANVAKVFVSANSPGSLTAGSATLRGRMMSAFALCQLYLWIFPFGSGRNGCPDRHGTLVMIENWAGAKDYHADITTAV